MNPGNDNATIATDVKSTCKAIADALKRRSGKPWSVTHGRGTAYGWITIHVPPKRRGEYGCMPEEDRAELASLLGLRPGEVHQQGVSIAASHDYRRCYIERAETGASATVPVPYWD